MESRSVRYIFSGQFSRCWLKNASIPDGEKYFKCSRSLFIRLFRHLHCSVLRPCVYDNHCYLTIKSDTGQHLQFLRCLTKCSDLASRFATNKMFKTPNIRIPCLLLLPRTTLTKVEVSNVALEQCSNVAM